MTACRINVAWGRKAISDAHGHPVGDRVLCRVSEISAGLLPLRGIFARPGGEEFGILLPQHDLDQTIAVAETLRLAIARIAIPVAGQVVPAHREFRLRHAG